MGFLIQIDVDAKSLDDHSIFPNHDLANVSHRAP
jgi:hypothetical protein